MKSIVASVFSAVLLVLTLTNCAQNPVTCRTNFVTMSEAQEVQVGRQEDVKVRQEYGVYDNKALQQYVNEVGQQLAKNPGDDAIIDLRAAGPAQGAPLDVLRKVLRGNLGTETTQMTINGMYPSGEPAAGQPLKVIE